MSRRQTVNFPNGGGVAWPSPQWATDIFNGTGTVTQVTPNIGRLNGSVAGTCPRAIHDSQSKHVALDYRGSIRADANGLLNDFLFYGKASGGWGTNVSTDATGYFADFDGSTNTVGLGHCVAATATTDTTTAFTFTANVWVNFHFSLKPVSGSVNNCTCSLKVWTAGTNEPGAWTIQSTRGDFANNTAGVVQCGFFTRTSVATNWDLGPGVIIGSEHQKYSFTNPDELLTLDEEAGVNPIVRPGRRVFV